LIGSSNRCINNFALFLISGLGFIELVFSQGGYFGTLLAKTEIYLGPFMSVILSIITLVISQIIIFDGVPKISIFRKTEELEYSEDLSEQEEKNILKSSTAPIKSTKSLFFNKKKKEETDSAIEKKEEKKVFKISAFEKNKSKDEGENMTEKIKSNNLFSNRKVVLPPINLLSKDKG
jgi:hypothetical protein